jgi:hypothetical protein
MQNSSQRRNQVLTVQSAGGCDLRNILRRKEVGARRVKSEQCRSMSRSNSVMVQDVNDMCRMPIHDQSTESVLDCQCHADVERNSVHKTLYTLRFTEQKPLHQVYLLCTVTVKS